MSKVCNCMKRMALKLAESYFSVEQPALEITFLIGFVREDNILEMS